MNKDFLNKLLSELNADKNNSKNARVLVVDAMNTFLRSFAIIQHLNPNGHHVGGLVGFLKSVGYAIKLYQPSRVVLVFDGQGNSTNKIKKTKKKMEFTEDEISDCVSRWSATGLLYNLPLHEKQELAPIFDNVSRLALSLTEKNKISIQTLEKLEDTMFPICRRLYRRVGFDFDIERMVDSLIK